MVPEIEEEFIIKITLNESDLIDAACVYVAEHYNRSLHDLQAELSFQPEEGITATVTDRSGTPYPLDEQQLIDGTAIYLSVQQQLDPNQMSIELIFDEDRGVMGEVFIQ